jgi:hypothetical protein
VDNWLQIALTSITTVLASSGFWAYRSSKNHTRDATTRLLMGLAYETITTLGVAYIERGWVTKDEYEELNKYFFTPYKDLGGNGVAERVMNEVSHLPLSSHNKYAGIFTDRSQERFINNVRVVENTELRSQAPSE